MISDTDKLTPFGKKAVNDSVNEAAQRVEKIFCECSGCYYVDIVRDFFSDERSQTNLSPVHFEPICYTEEARIIKEIITRSPEQKHYTAYSARAHAARILRLKKAGNTAETLLDAFPREEDRALIALSETELEKRLADV